MAPIACPFCRALDVRTIAEADGLHSYRCHDCDRVFHVADEEPVRATVKDGSTADDSATPESDESE